MKRQQTKNQPATSDQFLFQTHVERIPFQKKVFESVQVQRVVDMPIRKKAVEYIYMETLDSQNRIVVTKIPKQIEPTSYEHQYTIQNTQVQKTITDFVAVEYKSCPLTVLNRLGQAGHKETTLDIKKNQQKIENIKSKKEILSEELAQQLKEYMEANNKLISQLQEQIRNLKDRINQIDAKLANLKLLQKYLMPKLKIKQKLSDLQQKNKSQFIYIRCLHRTLNSFFQSVLLSKSNYLQVNNPHEYTNIKKIASKISEFVEDIPIVSTFFSVAQTSLTFVLEAKEEFKLEETKSKVDKIIQVSAGAQIDEGTQKLSLSILGSLIEISNRSQKKQEIKTATQNPKNFEAYRDLSWAQSFMQVYNQLRKAVAGANKSKSLPILTALYADWDYAKVMTCLFDLQYQKVNNIHDLLSQALDPSLQKIAQQSSATKKECCQCTLI